MSYVTLIGHIEDDDFATNQLPLLNQLIKRTDHNNCGLEGRLQKNKFSKVSAPVSVLCKITLH